MARRRRSQSTGSDEDTPRSTSRRHRRQRLSSRGHRRRDGQSGSDTEPDVEKLPKKRQTEYTAAEEKIRTVGRGFGIFHEMWRMYGIIINKGLEATAADPSTLPAVDRPYVNGFNCLLAFSSAVKNEITGGEGDTMKIISLLEAARSDTRRSHASAIKKSIGDWHCFSPGLSKQRNSPRGWDHDECARLLCPPPIEWNEMNKQSLRDPVIRARFELGPGDFPRFLWEGETMDTTNPTVGFLLHPILFAALRHFTVSPSNGVDPASNMSTKCGYAKQCGVKHVTIESIAYAATMVRYTLSSDKRFSSSAGFKYKDMYYAIINFVKVWPEVQVRQLLSRWDREVFSPMQMDDEPDSEGPDVDSLAAQLTRQVEMMMAQDSQGSVS